MTLKTFNSLVYQHTVPCMEQKEKEHKKQRIGWIPLGHWQLDGIKVMKGKNFIRELAKSLGKKIKKNMNALIAIKYLRDILAPTRKDSVLHIVNPNKEENSDLIMKKENAKFAQKNLNAINTFVKEHAVRVVKTNYYQIRKRVYDLTIEDAHCFYANDILVSNCHDALQYNLMRFAADRIIERKATPKPEYDPFANNTVFRWQN